MKKEKKTIKNPKKFSPKFKIGETVFVVYQETGNFYYKPTKISKGEIMGITLYKDMKGNYYFAYDVLLSDGSHLAHELNIAKTLRAAKNIALKRIKEKAEDEITKLKEEIKKVEENKLKNILEIKEMVIY